jgi:hypothetical protein
MVPSARLELAQLSPLPPQDSVSTNFTTTAALSCLNSVRRLAAFCSSDKARVYSEFPSDSEGIGQKQMVYFAGICAAPVGGGVGTEGTSDAAGATTAAPSKTLPDEAGRKLPK